MGVDVFLRGMVPFSDLVMKPRSIIDVSSWLAVPTR